MIIPMVCFSCGKTVSNYWEKFEEAVKKGQDPAKALDALGVDKYCCRRMILSNVQYIDEIMKYPRF